MSNISSRMEVKRYKREREMERRERIKSGIHNNSHDFNRRMGGTVLSPLCSSR